MSFTVTEPTLAERLDALERLIRGAMDDSLDGRPRHAAGKLHAAVGNLVLIREHAATVVRYLPDSHADKLFR